MLAPDKSEASKGGGMKLFYGVAVSFVLLGCVTSYRDFPVEALDHKPQPGTCVEMYYNIKKFDVLDVGGYSRLQDIFRNAGLCRKMVPVDNVPGKGLYVEVDTKWKPLSLPALVFGYLSISTLTFLPAWSTNDGYLVRYDLYIDGEKKETYSYEITRTAGIWIVLLPFAWVNLLTYGEEQAFEATANQFVKDAGPYLVNTSLFLKPRERNRSEYF
jgi:hypothetical protein